MRPIDADALERMGYVLTRTYKQDKETMVYETKKFSDVPSVQPDLDSAYQEGYTAAEAKYRAIIDDMKAIQTERKKGRWSKPFNMGTYKYQCSECEKLSRAMYDFCPICCADMRGESE